MYKKVFFTIVMVCFTLNFFAQEEKRSLFQKVVGTAIKTIFTIDEKISSSPRDTIGRDIHKRDALSTRYSRSPQKMGVSSNSLPLAQVIYDNKPKQLEKYPRYYFLYLHIYKSR